MTNTQLKDSKDGLCESADQLRANSGLKPTEYATPMLGPIFLRSFESKYCQDETGIDLPSCCHCSGFFYHSTK